VSALAWPVDSAKLDRVRTLMADEDLDALVVRAPDNVVYLTSYWCMKGYDAVVFPREGDPALIVLEPQREDAERNAWTSDLRTFGGYDPGDPRPPFLRALDLCAADVRARGARRIGLELSQGTQASDRMVGEPTVFSKPWFDGFDGVAAEVVDASPLLARARSLKTEQEVQRMRLANEIAALAYDEVRERIRPGMRESEVGALYEGHAHAVGIGYAGKVEMARAFTLVWSGPGIRTFTATGDRPVVEDEPTLLEIWVCADGYWTDLTKNVVPGRLRPAYDEMLDGLLAVYARAVDHLRPGASLADLDVLVRDGLAALGYPGQPSHPIAHGVGARAHEPPYAHRAAGGSLEEGMVLAIEPGAYWDGGGGLRVEDDFLVTAAGSEKLSTIPDDFRHP
jgi:Xaa-Pro aminopeptidase